jgi:hypothetical protein
MAKHFELVTTDIKVEKVLAEIEARPEFFVGLPINASLESLPQVRRLVFDGFAKTLGLTDIGNIRIWHFKPNDGFEPRTEESVYAKRYERFHIALKSNAWARKGVWFVAENPADKKGEGVQMEAGSCWWMDRRARHWVMNESDEHCIHLVIDAVAPNYARVRNAA